MIQPSTEHKATHWRVDGFDFMHIKFAPKGMELNKVFFEGILIGAVDRSVWSCNQKGIDYTETPECLIVRDAGQVFSVKSLQLHEQLGGDYRAIEVKPDVLNALYHDHSEQTMPQLDFRQPIIENKALRDRFFHMHKAVEESEGDLEKTTHLAEFLTLLAAQVGHKEMPVKQEKQKCYVRDVIAYLGQHFSRNVTLTELVNLTQVNGFVLLRQFKKETGITPHEYLHAYRINKARQLIRDGFKLADVAAICGFADQSHFTRLFKRMVGVTPGQFLPLRQK